MQVILATQSIIVSSHPEGRAKLEKGSAMNPDHERRKKVVIAGFLWGAMAVSYMIRYALGIVAPTLMSLYNLSPTTMGYVLSGWNWSYTGSMLFVGPVIDRFGPWIVMGGSSLIWGIATLALPLAGGAVSLFLLRTVFGFGQSALIPATSTSISRIFGSKQRARAVAVAYSGNQVGLVVSAIVSAFLLSRFGWQAVFYALGGGSLLLTLGWVAFYPDKRVGRFEELAAANPARTAAGEPQGIRWISLFRYRSTWGIAFGQMGYLYALFFFISWFPGYLVLERHMTTLRSGFVAALPFWAGMLGTLGGGWLGDFLILRGVRPTVSRKSIIGVAFATATVMVITAAFIEQTWLAVTLLTLSVGSLRMATGSVNSTSIDLAAPSIVGSLNSIQNFFGNIGGLLAPIVTGYIVGGTGSFVGAFVIAGGMALFSAICYIFIVGDLDTQQIVPASEGARVPLPHPRTV